MIHVLEILYHNASKATMPRFLHMDRQEVGRLTQWVQHQARRWLMNKEESSLELLVTSFNKWIRIQIDSSIL